MGQQMLNIAHQAGRTNLVMVVACKWMGKECTTAHLLRDCQMFQKKTAKEKMDHVMVFTLGSKNLGGPGQRVAQKVGRSRTPQHTVYCGEGLSKLEKHQGLWRA
jgi:hypothetical protein